MSALRPSLNKEREWQSDTDEQPSQGEHGPAATQQGFGRLVAVRPRIRVYGARTSSCEGTRETEVPEAHVVISRDEHVPCEGWGDRVIERMPFIIERCDASPDFRSR